MPTKRPEAARRSPGRKRGGGRGAAKQTPPRTPRSRAAGSRAVPRGALPPALLDSILQTSLAGIAVLRGRDFRFQLANPVYRRIDPRRRFTGRTFAACWPEAANLVPVLTRVLETGETFHAQDSRIDLARRVGSAPEESYFTFTFQRIAPDEDAEPRILVTAVETTAHVLARRSAEEGEERLRLALEASRSGMWEWDLATGENVWSDALWELYGLRSDGRKPSYEIWRDSIHPADRARTEAAVRSAAASGQLLDIEYRVGAEGSPERWLVARGGPVREASGAVVRYRGVSFDVTAVKQVTQLAADKQRSDALEEAVAQLPIGVVVIEEPPDGPPVVVAHNAAYRRIVASAPDRPTRIEELRYALFHADRAAPIPPPDWPGPRAARTGETVHDQELHLRRDDGSWRVLSVSAAPVGTAEPGRSRRAVAVLLDVTERKQAEASRHASDARYRSLVDRMPIGIVESDPAGANIYANAAAEAITGRSAAELRGAAWHEVIHPEDRERITAGWYASVQAGRPFEAEYRLLLPDGTVRDVHAFSAALRDAAGQVNGFLGAVHDVTAERKALSELAESEARFRDVAASAGEYVFEMDARGVIAYISDAVEKVLGWRADEIVGRSSFDFMDPEEVPRSGAFLAEKVARKERFNRLEQVARHRSGRKVFLEISAVPVVAADGSLRGYRGTALDATERREAEAARARLQEQLAQSQKMEVVGRLAGGVAHDFNNLLTVILTCGIGLQEDLREGRPGDPEQAADVVAAAQRAADLTRQLLAFARREIVTPEVVELDDVLRQARKLLGRVIGEDVRVVEDFTGELWKVRCDRGLLTQVVMNLAVNARDAMPRGGTLRIATANRRFAPGAPLPDPEMAPGDWVELTVRDDGQGMTREVLDHAFEPFYTTKPVGHGTGLGLATVYGIVKQAGGAIAVASEPGLGTEFRVYLPALPPGEAAAAPPPATLPGGAESILVVEDEPKVRDATVNVLRAAGYRVHAAGGAEEALVWLREEGEPVDLVVTDVVMPGTGGKELARAVEALRPGTRVLYVSGFTRDATLRHGVSGEGPDFLAKPFTPEELRARVRAALDRR